MTTASSSLAPNSITTCTHLRQDPAPPRVHPLSSAKMHLPQSSGPCILWVLSPRYNFVAPHAQWSSRSGLSSHHGHLPLPTWILSVYFYKYGSNTSLQILFSLLLLLLLIPKFVLSKISSKSISLHISFFPFPFSLFPRSVSVNISLLIS